MRTNYNAETKEWEILWFDKAHKAHGVWGKTEDEVKAKYTIHMASLSKKRLGL